MKNYIGLLTKEEQSTLCKIITGKEFKELFIRSGAAFSRIKKGFSPKFLTEQQALSIAIANIDKPLVERFVNTIVERWLSDIQKNIKKLQEKEEKGLSHGAALATTMLDSFFVNDIKLYFKLTEAPLETSSCSTLAERMEDIKSERAKNAETANRIKAMEEENCRLSEQVKSAQHEIDIMQIECKKKVQEIEQAKNKLADSLTEAEAKITELQTVPTAFKSDDADYLAQFDDRDVSVLPSTGTDKIVSLCGVALDYTGQRWLERYADLDSHGRYFTFRQDEAKSPYFTNRDRIFYNDGPSDIGFYGIWTWSAVPNKNDPTRDYIQSQYNTKIDAIEVVVTQATNIDDLANLLKNGVEYKKRSGRVMFSLYASKGQYIGILCNTEDLKFVNEKAIISENCIIVPVYEFSGDNIMRLDRGLSFYRNAFAGIPSELYYLKTPLDIVKDSVLSSISWSAYKTRRIITNAEYNTFKDFIRAIPVDDITSKIAAKCRCSMPAAKKLLDEFLRIVWKYINGDSLDDEIVRSAILASDALQQKAKDLIRADWETENKSLIAEAKKEIDSLNAKLDSAVDSLTEAQEVFNKTKAEDERLSGIIVEKEKLAEDVEKAVAERIQKARENVADFIANMAFVSGQQAQAARAAASPSGYPPSAPDMAAYCIHPKFENLDDLEAHHSWADVINTARFELAEAGVAEKHIGGLAAFLCAAYIEKQPLLLAGPNASDIIQAFSAAVTAHKHGILYCEGSYTHQAIEKIGADGEDIVIINNLLASGWINRLPEILSQKEIFYMATHPYAEDIQVEPKSLYGFMLPVFTEFFVDKKATGKYYGGYFANDFKSYSAPDSARKKPKGLSKFSVSPLVRNQINKLVTTMDDIYSDTTVDDEFLFAVLPIAYASLAMNELAEMIDEQQNETSISAGLKQDLQYVLGKVQ